MVVVVMGVSGVGKTHIGKLVAAKLDLPFFDADDFHPEENVEKMAKGIPLDDEDRWPWLDLLSERVAEWSKKGGAVLACSALKEEYRKIISSKTNDTQFVMLKANRQEIFDRMKDRAEHYMPASLLDSQISTLEELDNDHIVWNSATPDEVAQNVIMLVRGTS